MAQTKAYVEAKAWGKAFFYQPHLVNYIRGDDDEIVDHEYKYLGQFRTEEAAVAALRKVQGDETGYVERYRWDISNFEDDKHGRVFDADPIQDDSYYLEVEPI
jgi:hypothetical protein